MRSLDSSVQPATSARSWANDSLPLRQARRVLAEQAGHVAGEDAAPGFGVAEALRLSSGADVDGDADSGLAHSHDDEALVGEAALLDPHGGHQDARPPPRPFPGCHRRTTAPDRGTGSSSVNALCFAKSSHWTSASGKFRFTPRTNFSMKLPVPVALEPVVPPSQVQRVVEQPGVVRADVERHRQAAGRVQAASGDVERDLADRDAHAVGAEVAEAENALAVGDDDQVDARQRHALEDLVDAPDVVRAEVDAAIPAGDVAQLQAGLADRRRVDDRHHLGQVLTSSR